MLTELCMYNAYQAVCIMLTKLCMYNAYQAVYV